MRYSPSEIDGILSTMEIIVDTREQNTPALKKRMEGVGCPSVRAKLDYGDYSFQYTLPDKTVKSGADIAVIERKMSLSELASCFAQGRARYRREFERAATAGVKIHTIIENASYEKLYNGTYHSKLKPKSFIRSYLSWANRYNMQLHFCKAETTPKLIYDILYYALREYLINLE